MDRELPHTLLGVAALWNHTLDEITAVGRSSGPPLAVQLGMTVLVFVLSAIYPDLVYGASCLQGWSGSWDFF